MSPEQLKDYQKRATKIATGEMRNPMIIGNLFQLRELIANTSGIPDSSIVMIDEKTAFTKTPLLRVSKETYLSLPECWDSSLKQLWNQIKHKFEQLNRPNTQMNPPDSDKVYDMVEIQKAGVILGEKIDEQYQSRASVMLPISYKILLERSEMLSIENRGCTLVYINWELPTEHSISIVQIGNYKYEMRCLVNQDQKTTVHRIIYS